MPFESGSARGIWFHGHMSVSDNPVVNETESRAMPPWVVRSIVLFFVGWTVMVCLWWIAGRLSDFAVLVVISLFLSFALEPAVNRLARRGMRRGVATGIVFFAAFVLIGAFMALMATVVVDQATSLVDEAPTYIEDLTVWLEEQFDVQLDSDSLAEGFQEGGTVRDIATGLAGNLVDVGLTAVTVLFDVLTITLFTFYLVADGPKLRRVVLSFLRPERQREVLRIWDLAIEKTGGYIYSRTLLAALSAGVHGVAFTLLDVPFPIPLALWVGLLSQFVPTVGTYLAGILPVLITLAESPARTIPVLVVIVLYQQFENYVLQPRITAQHLDMHPAVAFGSVIVGAQLLGAAGAVLAIPAAATGQSMVQLYTQRHDIVEAVDES